MENKILKIVSESLGIPEYLIKGKLRVREYVDARNITVYFIAETGLKQECIGRFIGYGDRSSVVNAIKTVNDLLITNKNFTNKFNLIKQRLCL